jgi:3-mercaptopyruvate sulfurtransferase SseA
VRDLKAVGVENAAALLGGYIAWLDAGLPVEKGDAKPKGK